uniref:O-acyltransferase n=1 Tax=Globodera rostochiensis TaxID=31243 RepID=A0A914HF23_GLORO
MTAVSVVSSLIHSTQIQPFPIPSGGVRLIHTHIGRVHSREGVCSSSASFIPPEGTVRAQTHNPTTTMLRHGVDQSSDCNGMDEKDVGAGGDDMAETPGEQKTMLEDHAQRDGQQCQAVAAQKKQQRPSFREKHFTIEAPLLEHYFNVNDGKHLVLFNFFVAVFVLAAMAAWAQDFQRYGNPLHHLWLIAWNFHQLPQTMLVWAVMFCSTVLLPFNGIWLWQCLASPAAVWPRVVLIGAYVVYQLAFFYYSIRAIFWLDLQGACSFIITCENTRIAMKIHSFFRESLATSDKIGQRSKNDEPPPSSSESEQPGLKQFIYFMFCPTFIYRHSYPQSPTRSWHKVGRHLVACLASMYFVSLCFSQWIVPHFSALKYPEDIQWHLLVATIFPSIIPGAISLFLGVFYGILHSWLSMFAEALRFGDRRFYANWWSSRNMAEYYRNWNLVVHDWLYAYIYRDISMLLGTRWGPAVSQCLVFFLSSCFHEYWFAVSLRMFYPAIFTLYFIFGGVFFLISRMIKRQYIWNTLMWWNLLIGTGMFVVCYASEWYARQRCAQVHQSGTLMDIIAPRGWECRRVS